MNKYELLYIIDKDVADERRDASIKMVEDTILEQGGEVSNVDKWGMKKYAYPINYKNEGYYCLVAFNADPSNIAELERRMRVNDAFVRFMITSVIENKKTERAKTAKKPERRDRPIRESKPVEDKVVEAEVEKVIAEEPAQEKTEE